MTGKLWHGGVPTDVDVRTLLERYGCPDQGTRWSYEEISRALNIKYGTTRFRTVTGAWRREVYKLYNRIIGCEAGEGFVVLKEPERVGVGVGWYKGALRKLRKTRDVLSGCDNAKLEESQIAQKSHVERVSAHLLMAERMEARRLLKTKNEN